MRIKLFIFALITLFVASCARENLHEPALQESRLVTITATIEPQTRVSYDDVTLKLSWEDNDELMLVGYQAESFKGKSKFKYSKNGNNFSGQSVEGADAYRAYYPAGCTTLDDNGRIQCLDDACWQQTQNGDNNAAHIGNKMFLTDEVATPLNQPFQLSARSSIINFILKNIPGNLGTLRKLIWTIETTAEGDPKSATLNLTNIPAGTTSLTAFLAFDPSVFILAAGGKVKITLIGDLTYEWSVTSGNGKKYEAGKRYNAPAYGPWTMTHSKFSYVIDIRNKTTYSIIQKDGSSTSPANLTIVWGDGSPNTTIAKGASLSKTIATHSYPGKGLYTISIYSEQTDPSIKQMPQITFNGNSGDKELKEVLTPFPNMGTTDFSSTFEGCQNLTTIPAGLFENNPDAINFNSCFSNCSSLVLREDIFPLPSSNPDYFAGKKMDFTSSFNKVGSTYKTETGTAPELWNYNGAGVTGSQQWVVTDAFKNADKLTNYNSIPSNWR